MGVKHKKTRKQKIIADYRHNFYTLKNNNASVVDYVAKPTVIKANTNSYSYILHDVTKTGFLTFSIIIAEIILFFILKNHIITLPKISY